RQRRTTARQYRCWTTAPFQDRQHEVLKTHFISVEAIDSGETVTGAFLRGAHSALTENSHQISSHGRQELLSRPARFDPTVEVAPPQIAPRSGMGPVAVAPVDQREISPSDPPFLREVEAAPPTYLLRRLFTDLHRALRGEGIGPPHFGVPAMAGLCAI